MLALRLMRLSSILFLLFSQMVYAGYNLDQLSASDVDGINKDFSAMLSHTTVSPAGGLLLPKTYEIGLVGGLVSAPNLNDLVEENDPGNGPGRLPYAGLVGLYSYSRRTVFEIKYVPDITLGDLSLGTQSFAAKFTMPDALAAGTFMAVRAQLTNSYIRGHIDINNASTGNQSVSGRTVFESLSLGIVGLESIRWIVADAVIVEPYLGAGVIESFGSFAIKTSVPGSIFTSGKKSQGSQVFGGTFLFGVELHYLFSKLGFEYSRLFDSDRIAFKISFGY